MKRLARRTMPKGRKVHSRRAIPGSVFTIQRAEVIYNKKMLKRFLRLHRSGKLSLAFPLSKVIAKKYGLDEKKHWLVPSRKPSTPPAGSGLHERTLFARVGNREIAFKGSGAPFDEILDLDDSGRYRVSRGITLAIRWKEHEILAQRKLWGGADKQTIQREAEIAMQLHKTFNRMLKEKNPVLMMAAKMGVRRMPTLEPIAIFHPLQTAVDYRPRRETIEDKKFLERLSAKDRKVFDFMKKRDASRKQPKGIIDLKVPVDGKLLKIKESQLRNLALLVYSCKSQYRLMEAEIPIKSKLFLSKEIRYYTEDYEGVALRRSLESLHELFRVNGLKLIRRQRTGAKSGEKFELIVLEQRNGRWRRCSMRHAADKILSGFVTNLGTAIYVMHSGLKGAYSNIVNTPRGEQVISSLSEQNLSIAGEPLDLDTARINIQNRELRHLLQEKDVELAHRAIKKIVSLLYSKEELKAKATEAIAQFDRLRLGEVKAKL